MVSGYRVSSHREEMDFDAIHTYIKHLLGGRHP